MRYLERQIPRDRKNQSSPGLGREVGGGGEWEFLSDGYRVSFWDDEENSGNSGDGYATL